MEHTSISVRVWKEQLEIIEKAARKLGYESTAEYVRQRLMPIAAKDLGVELPEFPAFVWKKTGPLKQVAAATGMSKKQLERAWLSKLAEMAMSNPKMLDELKRSAEDEEPPSDRSVRQTQSNIEGLAPPKGAPIVRRRKTR